MKDRETSKTRSEKTERDQSHPDLRKMNEQCLRNLQKEIRLREVAEERFQHRTQQLEYLASKLTLAEQNERKRVAQLLHDELQQMLVAMKIRLSIVERGAKDSAQIAAVQEVRNLIHDSIEFSRELVNELCPTVLQENGLVPALAYLSKKAEQRFGLSVKVDLDEKSNPESEEISLLLYQATKELLFNVANHANVKEVRISSRVIGDQIELTVSDHGKGFELESVMPNDKEPSGFGLFSIRERLHFMNGRLEIRSAPGKGSVFKLIAPIRIETKQTVPASEEIKVEKHPWTMNEGAMDNDNVRVLLVDDHALIRRGLAQLLNSTPGIRVIGEASEGGTAIEMVRQLHPDVVTMDVSLPKISGVETTRLIHEELPEVKIIGLSMFDEPSYAEAMKEAGAVGYLSKSGPTEDLAEFIIACRE